MSNLFSQIVEGWRNNLIPPKELKQQIELVSSARMSICRSCPHNSKNVTRTGISALRFDEHCVACGCTLAAKTRALSASCPLAKWTEVSSEEDWLKIQQTIESFEKYGDSN